jgi:hypothetical protein
MLERIGPAQLRPGEPVYSLQERLSLAYLYHRFAIGAVQRMVGGVRATSALAGDGQVPIEPVPADRQRRALDALLGELAPQRLDLPERLERSLPPPPDGFSATRERFASDAGGTFSRLTAARTLALLVVGPLLDAERCARLSQDTGPGSLALAEMLRRMVDATWSAPPARDARERSLQHVAERAVLDGLSALGSSESAAPEVRAAAIAELARLRVALRSRRAPDDASAAHVASARRDLDALIDRGQPPRGRPEWPAPPPGRPIGARKFRLR